MPLSAPFWVPGGVHHHADIVMQESSCLFAQAGERPRLYERLLYSAGHPTSGVRHNDEQEQYNDILTGAKENYSAESSALYYVYNPKKNNRPLHYISTMTCFETRLKFFINFLPQASSIVLRYRELPQQRFYFGQLILDICRER